ncbi:MAG: M20/M25/M40 family metallo-hydrolase [Terracidiphilus sp.]|jgi:acetylornithine deacetylase/succinyl-diaminopimelate desuccinylase-like protein
MRDLTCRYILRGWVKLIAVAAVLLTPSASIAQIDAPTHKLALDIFKQLIEINTTESSGSVTAAAVAMRQRFLTGGFAPQDVYLGGPNERKKNLVVRLHGDGSGKRPILLICHLDVVEARREDWSVDPFQFIENDGYYYGRGTQDIKDGDAILVAIFLRLKQENYHPDRDLILALTADEEAGGTANGVDWLLRNQRQLIDAGYVINLDQGGVDLEHGKPLSVNIAATEKLYGDYLMSVTNRGGHSSIPRPDNAIYQLAGALTRLEHHEFAFELNPVTRAYFETISETESGQKAADLKAMLNTPPDPKAIERLSASSPSWHSMMHTTCVATRLSGGHANNALPQKAEATVNCRILPGHTLEEVRQEIIATVGDSAVTVRYSDYVGSVTDTAPARMQLTPVEPNPVLMNAVRKLSADFWPGAPVIPMMETGASDGVYTLAAGMPTYGVNGVALEVSDFRAHGRDERVPVASFDRGLEFNYQLLKMLTTPSAGH